MRVCVNKKWPDLTREARLAGVVTTEDPGRASGMDDHDLTLWVGLLSNLETAGPWLTCCCPPVGVGPLMRRLCGLGVHVKPGETESGAGRGGHTKSSLVKSGQVSFLQLRLAVSHQTERAGGGGGG